MKPQQVKGLHIKPPDHGVELPADADPRALHVLLTIVLDGALSRSRDGRVELTRHLATRPAPPVMADCLELAEKTGLVTSIERRSGRYRITMLTAAGEQLLAQLDAEIFGGVL